MDKGTKEIVVYLSLVFIFGLFIAGIGSIQTYMEMKTFNKFSKTKATFWDAAFSNLRVYPTDQLRQMPRSVRFEAAKKRIESRARLNLRIDVDPGEPTIKIIQRELVRRQAGPLGMVQNRLTVARSQ